MSSTPNSSQTALAITLGGARQEPAAREPRVRALLTATVSTFDNALSTPCLVHNISPAGARLSISASIPLGAEFKVSIPQRNISRRARQIWRKGDQLGVEFPSETSAAVIQDEADKDAKIRALEAEIAGLKAEIVLLRSQLFRHGEK